MKAWNGWKKMPTMTEVFIRLSEEFNLTCEDFAEIEHFTVLLHDTASTTTEVNECRRMLFTKRNRNVETIPPTSEALRQHVKRSILQANIWKKCLTKQLQIPTITDWGWK